MKGDSVVAEEWKFVGRQEFCSCVGAPWHLQISILIVYFFLWPTIYICLFIIFIC